MPSLAHAADLERVLTRAAEECESGGAWFGEGLPQALKSAIDASGKSMESAPPLVAFVEAVRRLARVEGQAFTPEGVDELFRRLGAGAIDQLAKYPQQ